MAKRIYVKRLVKLALSVWCLLSISIFIIEVMDVNLRFKSMVLRRFRDIKTISHVDTEHFISQHKFVDAVPSEQDISTVRMLAKLIPAHSKHNKPIILANGSTSIPLPEHMNDVDLRDAYIHTADLKRFVVIKKLARYRNHTNIGDGHYFIYSVIANINAVHPASFLFVVSGWEKKEVWETPYRCCFLHRDGIVTSIVTSTKRRIGFGSGTTYQARQIVCQYSGSGNSTTNPLAIGLVMENETCGINVIFEEPTYSIIDPSPRFGIIGKIAYGAKNPNQIIEWVEWNRFFGASKILIYPYYDLNKQARSVLEHYEDEGILQMIPLAPVPLLDKIPRYFDKIQPVMWQDEQVVNNDGQERMAPYKYFTLIDTDEFVLPVKKYKSFIELMVAILKKHPDAGSLMMRVHIHILSWGRSNADDPLMISRFSNHTVAMINTPKFLHVSDRVQPGTAWIHSSQTEKGYKRYTIHEDFVIMKHYRKCRTYWMELKGNETKTQCESFKRLHDTRLVELASHLQEKVFEVRNKLGIKY